MCENVRNIKQIEELFKNFIKENLVGSESTIMKSYPNSFLVQFEDSLLAFKFLKFMNLSKNHPNFRDLKNHLMVSKAKSESIILTKRGQSNHQAHDAVLPKPSENHSRGFSINNSNLGSEDKLNTKLRRHAVGNVSFKHPLVAGEASKIIESKLNELEKQKGNQELTTRISDRNKVRSLILPSKAS